MCGLGNQRPQLCLPTALHVCLCPLVSLSVHRSSKNPLLLGLMQGLNAHRHLWEAPGGRTSPTQRQLPHVETDKVQVAEGRGARRGRLRRPPASG